jgi:hypothetical protein
LGVSAGLENYEIVLGVKINSTQTAIFCQVNQKTTHRAVQVVAPEGLKWVCEIHAQTHNTSRWMQGINNNCIPDP